jgi:hypothetical protein
MDLRKIALENLAYRLALDDMGLYPMSVKGGSHPYEKRTERMEGHNAAVMEIHEKACQIEEFLSKCPCRTEVEDALLKDDIYVRTYKNDGVKLIVNCNDVFYWACADYEEIKLEELKDLADCITLTKSFGSMLWVCKKRSMRPQISWYSEFSEDEKRLFDSCGPERDSKEEG